MLNTIWKIQRRLFEVVETLGRVHLVTEWIRGGELYHRITHGGPLKESHAAPLYRQLLLAVKHMVSTKTDMRFFFFPAERVQETRVYLCFEIGFIQIKIYRVYIMAEFVFYSR